MAERRTNEDLMTGTAVMEVRGLRKEFRGRKGTEIVAVDNLDIAIPGGGVYGFLGPNGSGKTTTIRCLLGLIRPTSGSVKILGADTTTSLHQVIDRIGALVETPKFFPNFSGRKNLRMFARVAGVGKDAVDRSLETVGLADRGHDSFDSYSLGMKQRLAVAGTLLKDPELIILDEPANGLDPAGIVDIRRLIRSLGEQGKTIFVSSHQLAEVQQTCDDVMIISKGRLVRSGSVNDLVAVGSAAILVEIDNAAQAREILEAAGYVVQPGADDRSLSVETIPENAQHINHVLAYNNMFLSGLRHREASLESIFLELTGGEGEL